MHWGIEVADRSGIAEARRRATGIANHLGFSEEATGRVAIVVTELATNLWNHGQGGWCFVGASATGDTIDVVVADRGPGIREPDHALRDGYTTSTTPGTGLGAVMRMSRHFDVYTRPGQGTVCLARVPRRLGQRPPTEPIRFHALGAPVRGEHVSGDLAAARSSDGVTSFLVVDGLGHGPDAALAAERAAAEFRNANGPPATQMKDLHTALRATRGAAVAIAEVDTASGSMEYAGIGNISSRITTGNGTAQLASMNGTAGHIASTIRQFTYGAPPGALLIMHTDGISARWDLERYPGLPARDPAVIAAVIFRDFARSRDDATVLVARLNDTRTEAPHP